MRLLLALLPTGLLVTSRLKNYLQCKLHLPHRHLCRLINLAEAINGTRVQSKEVVAWRAEVRAIEYVEHLCPELDIESFPEPSDMVVFNKGHIGVD